MVIVANSKFKAGDEAGSEKLSKAVNIVLIIGAVLGLLFWIGWAIAFFTGDKTSSLSKRHINQALICVILSIIPIGITQVVALVFAIMGIMKAINEDETPLPLIGGIELIK